MSASNADLSALQGRWKQVAVEANGVHNPPDFHGAEGAITTIVGHRFEVRAEDGHLILKGDFTLDATTTPKSITWIDAVGEDMGRPLPAIYTLDADRFAFIAADENMPRPTTFHTGIGETMRSFVRWPG